LDYNEAMHIANFGAKIIHPKCLEAIEKKNIPLEIRNFQNPLEEFNYTRISEISDREQIKGISCEENSSIITVSSGSLVDVPGVLAKIFKVMSKNNISVSFVAQSASEVSTAFIVKKEDSKKALDALEKAGYFSEFFKITHEMVAILNITGAKILENKTKAMIFNALDEKKIPVIAMSQSTEELNLSLVIHNENIKDAILIVHKYLCKTFDENLDSISEISK
jgi:aspartokinase/homoserine dehydrogenase 1